MIGWVISPGTLGAVEAVAAACLDYPITSASREITLTKARLAIPRVGVVIGRSG